ncbi:MAG: RagB/SusD family nutrient uptake outer membrane protein [Bacteroidetes bacterium]|nr:RagB/SusD family nutrient uptake outer membrane protein [Bacteroidota bacterium]
MKNILKGSIILLIMVLVVSCSKDRLDPAPKTALGELQAFDTKDRIVGQVNGMYAMMKVGNFMGGRYFVYNDIRADNFIPKSTNGVTGFATFSHTVVNSTNEVQNLWGAVYAAVNAINIFIEGLDANWDSGKLTGIITEAEYKGYKAEALTLRAISYFSMLQLYAQPYNKNAGSSLGLPLRITAYKTGDGNDMARSSVAEVYTQILADLNAAEASAVANYSTPLLNTTRVHKNTIIAYKTRVYLHMNDFAKVQTEAAKMVSASAPFVASAGVANGLNPTFAGIWASPYTTKESIFSMPFTATNQPGTQNALGHYYHPSSSESHYLEVTGEAYTALAANANDARKAIFQTATVSGTLRYFPGKWLDFTTKSDYAPVIRYAEVLLNYAEAIVRGNNAVSQKAVDLLNAVRTRSYPGGAYTLASFANAQAFQNAIMLERSMEFLGEGIRNMDLLRTLSTIPAKTGVAAVASTSPTYIWPIPETELNINKLMVDN